MEPVENLIDINKYLDEIREKRRTEAEKVENNIEDLLNASRKVYWSVLTAQEKNEIDFVNKDYIGVLEKTFEYLEHSKEEICDAHEDSEMSSTTVMPHMIYKPVGKVDQKMRNFFSGLPIVAFADIKESWMNFYDVSSWKLFFVLLGSIFYLFFGEFTGILFTFIVMTILNFVMRAVANKYKDEDEYVGHLKNLQLFLFAYVMLGLGNLISGFISFNGLPEGTFYALYLLFSIWGELRSFVSNAKVAKLPIHPMLDKITNRSNKNDIDPPF